MNELDYTKGLLEIGDKEGAFKELTRILKLNPQNIDAWLLLAQAIDEKNKKMDCYRQVFRIEPNNQEAQMELKKLASENQVKTQIPKNEGYKYLGDTGIRKTSVRSILEDDRVFRWALLIMAGIIMLCSVIFLGGYVRDRLVALMIPTPTRFVFPPTWTPIFKSSPIPTIKSTQTPVLHSPEEAKSYIPELSELPYGFRIDPSGINAAMPIKNGVGWITFYSNPNAKPNEFATVEYTVLIFDREEDAVRAINSRYSEFEEDSKNPQNQFAVAQFIEDYEGIDGWATYMEADMEEYILSTINLVRIDNIIVDVIAVGMMSNPPDLSFRSFSKNMAYYVLLATNNIEQRN